MEQNLYNLYDDVQLRCLYQKYKRAVVKVFCHEERTKGQGWTGFLVSWDPCVIVTVAHSVRYLQEHKSFLLAHDTFFVKFYDDEVNHPAFAVDWSFSSDILILCCARRPSPLKPIFFTLADPDLPIDSVTLCTISHPTPRDWRYARGIVCCPVFHMGNHESYDKEMSLFDHAVPLFPGSSGAPLVDSAGLLRGMQLSELTYSEHALCISDAARRPTMEDYKNSKEILDVRQLPQQVKDLSFRVTNLRQAIHVDYIDKKLRWMLDNDGVDPGTHLVTFLRQSSVIERRIPPLSPPQALSQLIMMEGGLDPNAPQQPLHNAEFELFPSQNRPGADETDLSLRKLEELQKERHALQKEKSDRLKQVLDHLNTLKQTVNEVHPSLGDSVGTKSISSDTMGSLAVAIKGLRELKIQSMQQLQDLVTSILEFWNLMDTPIEEQQMFQNVTCNIDAIVTGDVDPAHILEKIVLQIGNTKEAALSRREILERVEKWMAACEEECWLEEYNKDENQYNSGRGTHLSMKRAEKAQALVNKLPGMVQTLALKTDAWEKEKGTEFIYDGIRLLSMLEEYNVSRLKREQERKRQKKKLEGQLIVEQEALFGSEPSPKKPQSLKNGSRLSYGGASNQRLSRGGAMLQTPKTDKLHSIKGTPNTRQTKKNERPQQNGQLNPREDSIVTTLSAGIRIVA